MTSEANQQFLTPSELWVARRPNYVNDSPVTQALRESVSEAMSHAQLGSGGRLEVHVDITSYRDQPGSIDLVRQELAARQWDTRIETMPMGGGRLLVLSGYVPLMIA